MPVTIVIGTQWGDEGKGKVVDLLAQRAHAVVRFAGGNNAGHTIKNEYGEFALHLIPAGIFNPETINVIERGVVVHPPSLVEEMKELEKRKVSVAGLKISLFAHLVMPWHIVEDHHRESGIKDQKNVRIGTTQKGIGPCYRDKAARWQAFQVADLKEKSLFLKKLEKVWREKKREFQLIYEGLRFPGLDEIRKEYLEARERILPYVGDTRKTIGGLIEKKRLVVLEGAQGGLLDLDYGTYPYVTSSNTTSLAACNLVGISPGDAKIVGVAKAYVTRVGEGPFPTEMSGRMQDRLRELGKEYGATTGRPRRCGWLDIPLLRYSRDINHLTDLVITKLDILGLLASVKLAASYRNTGRDLGDEEFRRLIRQHPEYEEFEGWGNLENCRFRAELPNGAQRYIDRVEKLAEVPVSLISIGGKRKEVISL